MFFTLKIYDTELMTFELLQKPLEGGCQNVSVKEENKKQAELILLEAAEKQN